MGASDGPRTRPICDQDGVTLITPTAPDDGNRLPHDQTTRVAGGECPLRVETTMTGREVVGPDSSDSNSPHSENHPGAVPLLGLRSFIIVVAAGGVGALAYPTGGWFVAVGAAIGAAAGLHALVGY